jgi:threonine/homoserine/homoserine lactone efflux protein
VIDTLFFFDEISTFFRGVVLGVLVAAPVGPVGLLCIKRTLQRGVWAGLATGFGAALADGIFGIVAAFGVTAVLQFVDNLEKEIRLVGGLMLVLTALYMLRQHVHVSKESSGGTSARNLIGATVSGLMITLTNPLTLIGVLAVVAAFSGTMTFLQAATLTGGIFCGSLAWWVFLCGGTFLVRHHFTDKGINWVNRVTAVLILLLGGWALYTGVAAVLGYPIIGPSFG